MLISYLQFFIEKKRENKLNLTLFTLIFCDISKVTSRVNDLEQKSLGKIKVVKEKKQSNVKKLNKLNEIV